jgi:hypothetical protein
VRDNHRAIDEATALEAARLILVPGGLPSGSRDLAGAVLLGRAMMGDGVIDFAAPRASGV